jgi:hypothetical protein
MRDQRTGVQAEQVPQLVFEALVDEFGEEQQTKHRGYVVTQSLTELMNYLDPDNVVRVRATADITNKDETVKGPLPPGNARHCVDVRERLVTTIRLNYDRGKHGAFPWQDICEHFGKETSAVSDLAVRELVIRREADELRDHLRNVLSTAVGLADRKYLRSPFFFKMGSRPAKNRERKQVKSYNDEAFLARAGYRVLELEQMYSLRAMQDKSDPVMGVTPQELEDLAFNFSDDDEQSFGALYSQLAINKCRQAFSRSVLDKTRMRWTEQETWERADTTDAGADADTGSTTA